ncbi:MAG: tetratricopeptide repeat protein [Candidatus Binatia bacterium]
MVSTQIRQHSQQAELYVKRAELHRLHGDWASAQADYNHASRLNPSLFVVDLGRGKLFLAIGQLRFAKTVLDRFLSHAPNHIEARLTRARVLAKLGQHNAAVQDYTFAIEQSPRPEPEYYIERAQILATVSDSTAQSAALRGLDEGIQKLGPLVTLELLAIDLTLQLKRYDDALTRLDAIASQFPRQETWLARRGDIFLQAGYPEAARQAFRAALQAIASLPPHRRHIKAVFELEVQIQKKLARIKSGE